MMPGIAFTMMLMLGSDGVAERLQIWFDRRPPRIVIAPAGLWALYVSYSIGARVADARIALLMAIYLAVPFLVLSINRKRKSPSWPEPVAILWIWLPIELGLIRRVLMASQSLDLHYVFAQILAINAGIIAFAVWKQTPNIGYRFEWDRRIMRTGIVNFVVFAIIAIPLGMAIKFIQFNFYSTKLLEAPAVFAGVFLFTALPEEFLFRGLIQNWIERRTKRPNASLALAAFIFGLAHLNNGPPLPNYKYFFMAAIAGMFYGQAWRRTGTLMSSSFTHALVDTFWTVFFR